MGTGGLEINALDLVNPDVSTIEGNLKGRTDQLILKYGGMSNGVGQMVTDVTRMTGPGRVRVLRIWSHGFPGGQGVSQGAKDARIDVKGQRVGISLSNLREVTPDLGRLASYFEPQGRLELRGCSVGAGDDGRRLLEALAKLVQADVIAALQEQPIGPLDWSGPVLRITRYGKPFFGSGPPIK
jgi:hypothetical protein